ncbi:DEAD box ATP-dependent RNA helicase [Entamoeba marina]
MSSDTSNTQKSASGFQKMGLNRSTLVGVLKKGYRVPTPIQRKAIPSIMTGSDVIAMARTGSGKTAAYLIPIINRLESHSLEGTRALIILPTRELALQTIKVFNELSKLTNLKASLIIGGNKLSDQFDNLTSQPDIIVATPGRLTFILEGSGVSLKTVEIVCFDEADLMFESGFSEQISDIMRLLPISKQILLFSATLPKSLGEFLKTSLKNPEIIRLDSEQRLSPDLENIFFHVKEIEKEANLLHLVMERIPENQQTVIFCATRHTVEFLQHYLSLFEIKSSVIFGKADQNERAYNMSQFRHGETHILLVTDVAARGVDIPDLDNVINYDFPTSPKLYIHRCGRVARAGRTGTCYNFVQTDEIAYLMDLKVFALNEEKVDFGSIPRKFLDSYITMLEDQLKKNYDLQFLKKGVDNALQMYKKSKPQPSGDGMTKAKSIDLDCIHPIYLEEYSVEDQQKDLWLKQIRNYRPKATIFSVDSTKLTKTAQEAALKLSRQTKIINAIRANKEKREKEQRIDTVGDSTKTEVGINAVDDSVNVEKRIDYISSVPVKKSIFDDANDRIIYSTRNPLDFTVEIAADEVEDLKEQSKQKVWDRKKKKFVYNTGGLDQRRREIKKKDEERTKIKEQFDKWKKRSAKRVEKEKGPKLNDTVKTKEDVLKKKLMKERHEKQKRAADSRKKMRSKGKK